MGWALRVSNPIGGFRFSEPIQTSPEAHPTSYTVGTGYLSRGLSGRSVEFTTHTPLEPKLKKVYSCTSTTLWVFTTCSKVKLHLSIYKYVCIILSAYLSINHVK